MRDSQYCWCGIYTRQSRSSEGDFTSCQAQFHACFEFICARMKEGWFCNGRRYDDEGSGGEGLNRPALTRLLADIDAGKVDRVVVHRLDRQSRSVADCTSLLQQLRDRSVPLTVVTAPEIEISSPDSLLLNLLASMAEFERETIRDRFADARTAHKRKGRRVAGLTPCGYEADPVTRQIVVHPKEAECIRRMFQLAVEGTTPREIATILNSQGWRTKTRVSRKTNKVSGGKPWTARAVLAALSNPVYAGLIRNGDETLPGCHEALVEIEVFEQVQQLFASRRSRPPGRTTPPFSCPLQGLLFCGRCDRVMSPSTSGYRNFQYRYYRCRSQAGGRPPCPGVSVQASEMEQYLLGLLRDPGSWLDESELNEEDRGEVREILLAWRALDDALAMSFFPRIFDRVALDPDQGTLRVTLDVGSLQELKKGDLNRDVPSS